MKIVLLLLAAGSLAPIWRDPSWEGGVNAWEAIWSIWTKPGKEHIPVDYAIQKANEAYEESFSL